MLKETVIAVIFVVIGLLTVIKAFGKHTNIDDPLDDKFWKNKV